MGDEPRFKAPRRAAIRVPADPVVQDPAKQSHVSVAWLLLNQQKEADPFEDFALAVASNLMLAGPQAGARVRVRVRVRIRVRVTVTVTVTVRVTVRGLGLGLEG